MVRAFSRVAPFLLIAVLAAGETVFLSAHDLEDDSVVSVSKGKKGRGAKNLAKQGRPAAKLAPKVCTRHGCWETSSQSAAVGTTGERASIALRQLLSPLKLASTSAPPPLERSRAQGTHPSMGSGPLPYPLVMLSVRLQI